MTSLALGGHHEHADDNYCHGGNFIALNRQGPQMRYCLWAPECDATPLAAVHILICALCGQRRGTVGDARYRLYSMKFGKLLKCICTPLTKKHVFFHMMCTHLQTILAKSAEKQTPPERDIAHF